MPHSQEYTNFPENLIKSIPEFQPTYEQHLQDNDEVLPHILMGDFTRFFVDVFHKAKNDQKMKDVLDRSVSFISTLFSSHDEMILDLVHTSFVENLQGEKDIEEIRKLFVSSEAQKSFDLVFG